MVNHSPIRESKAKGREHVNMTCLCTGVDAHPGPPGPWPGVRPNFFHFAVASTSGFESIAEKGLESIAEEE